MLAGERARAVVLNSGGANACTGPEGFQDTHATAEHAAAELGIGAIDVAVASHRADRRPAAHGQAHRRRHRRGQGAQRGRRTRRRPRDHDHRLACPRRPCSSGTAGRVGGMAKGAGMLAPSLATMLVVLTTDAVVPPDVLRPGAEDGDRPQLRAGRLRRLPVHQRHGDRAVQRRQRGHAERRGVHRGAHRRGAPTSRCSCSPTPRARPRTSRSPSATPPASRTRSPPAGPAPATTCSRRRCSATTPTGAGCSPRSAPPTPRSRPTRSTSPSTASPSAGAARSATRARASTSPAGRSPSTST